MSSVSFELNTVETGTEI